MIRTYRIFDFLQCGDHPANVEEVAFHVTPISLQLIKY